MLASSIFMALMAIQKWVAEGLGCLPEPYVVVSHSLGMDPRELDRALMIIGKRPFKVRLDPMGYFRITLDGKEILVEHRFEDVTLREYRGQDRGLLAAPDRPGRGRLGHQPRHLPGAPTGQGRNGPERRPGVRAGLAVSSQSSAFSYSKGIGEGKMSGGHGPPCIRNYFGAG